jgi:hypothetical protein
MVRRRPTVDLDDQPRQTGAAPDLGPYEQR